MSFSAGCGKEKTEDLAVEKEVREDTDVLSFEWKAPFDDTNSLPGFEIVEYIPDIIELPSESYTPFLRNVVCNGDIFFQSVLCDAPSSAEVDVGYALSSLDLNSGEKKTQWLSFASKKILDKPEDFDPEAFDLLIKEGDAQVTSIDITGDKLVLFMGTEKENVVDHVYKVVLDFDGTVYEIKDCIEQFLAPDERETGGFALIYIVPQPVCDQDGNIFLIGEQKNTLKIIDSRGKEIDSSGVEKLVSRGIKYVGKSISGTPLFSGNSVDGGTTIFYFDGKEFKKLYNGKIDGTIFSVDSFGNVILLKDTHLVTWNVKTGTINEIYKFSGLSELSCLSVSRNRKGEFFACYREDMNTFLYRINDEEHPEMTELVLLQGFIDGYTEKCAADYSRTHPGVKVTVKTMEETSEYEWAKVVQEVKDGKGPDMMLLNRKQLSTFQAVDLVCPIDEMIPEDVKSNIFGGVLKFGVFEDKMYALPYDASLYLLMVASEDKPDTGWTLSEVMDAYEEYKKKHAGNATFAATYWDFRPTDIFNILCSLAIEHSEFVDFETMTCNFKTENFYRLLRFCKENGVPESQVKTHYSEDIYTGDNFLYIVEGGLRDYSTARMRLTDKYHNAGFPTKDGTSGFITCYRGVAISSMSKHKEAAADFLSFLVSEKAQMKYGRDWIRKDVLKEHVKDADEVRKFLRIDDQTVIIKPALVMENSRVELDGRPDGTSYLDEYIELMDECVPASVEYEIEEILWEEIQYYFNGEKTEYEVADIIQSRVNIYLQERRH